MTKCLKCRYAAELPFGERTTWFCTKNPPTVEVLRGADGNGNVTLSLNGWWPMIAMIACGAFRRRRFWHRGQIPTTSVAPTE